MSNGLGHREELLQNAHHLICTAPYRKILEMNVAAKRLSRHACLIIGAARHEAELVMEAAILKGMVYTQYLLSDKDSQKSKAIGECLT